MLVVLFGLLNAKLKTQNNQRRSKMANKKETKKANKKETKEETKKAIDGLSEHITSIYTELNEIRNLESEAIGKGVALTKTGGPFEKRINKMLAKAQRISDMYSDSPVRISGFSISIGAIIANSSASFNFEFQKK